MTALTLDKLRELIGGEFFSVTLHTINENNREKRLILVINVFKLYSSHYVVSIDVIGSPPEEERFHTLDRALRYFNKEQRWTTELPT